MEAVVQWGEPLVFKGTKDAGLPPDVASSLDAYLHESQPKLLVVQPIRDDREKDTTKPAPAAVYLTFGAIPILLGLVGPTLAPGLDDGEQFLPTVARAILPTALFALLTGALVSAILSTIDSILLSIGGLVSHNVLVPVLGIADERTKLLSARAVVLGAGVLAFVLALYADGVYDLVETASAFGTAGILVTTLIGLYSGYGGPRSALAALGTGLVVTPLGEYVLELKAPFLTSVASALLAYLLVAFWCERGPESARRPRDPRASMPDSPRVVR
jgi:Na+/proline symporter